MPTTRNYISTWMIVLLGFIISCGESPKPQDPPKRRKKAENSALTIIRNDDCLNCHSIEDKVIGPSYAAIAERYGNDFSTVSKLAEKIMEGGGGLWGGAMMTKHPLMKKREAIKIVDWILTLDDPKTHAHISGPGMQLSDLDPSATGPGFNIKGYMGKSMGSASGEAFPAIADDQKPDVTFTSPAIDLKQPPAFAPLKAPFLLKIHASLTVEKRGVYFFKLEKGGKAVVKLNNLMIISERADDKEIDMKLEPGTYPLDITYLSSGKDDQLSLQWIPPDKDQYHILTLNP